MVFLVKPSERVLNAEKPREPNPECPTCSVAQIRLIIDPSRATLNDLVEDLLKMNLGYGEELSIRTEQGIVYDPDLEDNLSKKFSEMGIQSGGFVTVVDEEDENPRVNLVLEIAEQYVLPRYRSFMD
jgi:ubiquitin-like 1-activating enzyme E1 B